VDGPYLAAHPDTSRPWIGSQNQRFHFFTDRYIHLQNRLTELPDRLQVTVRADGTVSINGWASPNTLETLTAEIGLTTLRTGNNIRRMRARPAQSMDGTPDPSTPTT
jgi:hypothetical protein